MLLNRSLSERCIRIIENNAEVLTQGTVRKLQSSPRTNSYHNLTYRELYNRGHEIYHDLGRWLRDNSDQGLQAWYTKLGEKLYEEGIPLAEVLWALILTKNHLLEYTDACGLTDSAMELYQPQEFDRLIGHFFDQAVCYAAEGYEHHASEQREPLRNDRHLRFSRRL